MNAREAEIIKKNPKLPGARAEIHNGTPFQKDGN